MMKDKYNNLFNPNRLILGVMIAAIIMLSGLSYAWYKISISGAREITLTSGSLELTFTDADSEVISLNNAEPVSDEDGLAGRSYSFTLKNTGNIDSSYTLYLDDVTLDSGTRMKDDYIKYSLIKNNGDVNISKFNSSDTFTNESGIVTRIIGNDSITAQSTDNYILKIWIADTADNAVMNTSFKAKLRVEATQKVDNQPNSPVLVGDMIPVVYDSTTDSWIKSTTEAGVWYNYGTQTWANAVTIKDPIKRAGYVAANTGTTIEVADINTFLVWIPRYSYTLGNTYGYQIDGASTPSAATPGAFDIKFVNKNITDTGSASYTGSTADNYYTPTSFCWGDTCDTSRTDTSNIELSGIWVAKFETTGTIDAISSIPNVTSLRNQTNAAFFNGIQTQMNGASGTTNYGFSGSNYDTHMLKNNEWGAMAYLSQSKYGKYGNGDYTGANKEIYQNKSDGYITGSSNGTPSTSTTNTQVVYNVPGTGTGASTTGNISGIYDTSGGSWEPVMGNLNNAISNSGFSSMPSKRYYNLYTTKNASTACNGGVCLGDALSETASFYGDYAGMVSAQYPWVDRGGRYYGDAHAGVFIFDSSSGSAGSDSSARFVLGAW